MLAAVAELAKRHDARLVGIAATQPLPVMHSGFYDNSLSVAILHEDMAQETADAEAEFRGAFAAATHPVEWRSTWTCMALADYISGEARCADLILTSPVPQTMCNSARHVNIGELVLHAGCPVLVVPHSVERYPRSAPRGALSAPFAKAGDECDDRRDCRQNEIVRAQARADDVAVWLAGHGIESATHAAPSVGDDAATLEAIFRTAHADLIVARRLWPQPDARRGVWRRNTQHSARHAQRFAVTLSTEHRGSETCVVSDAIALTARPSLFVSLRQAFHPRTPVRIPTQRKGSVSGSPTPGGRTRRT